MVGLLSDIITGDTHWLSETGLQRKKERKKHTQINLDLNYNEANPPPRLYIQTIDF